ncbi:MAG: bifunctional ornithine acetyltransferase/N-acetylglutamate synthase, partial [Planctomycetota bacterium]
GRAVRVEVVAFDLAEDVARNGEGVHHVVRVQVSGCPNRELARGIGKSVVNSPLLQCAICGNDPNVGRLVCAIGKFIGSQAPELDLSGCRIMVGGETVFENGAFCLDPTREQGLHQHLLAAEMYASVPPADGLSFTPPQRYPAHERSVQIGIDLGAGSAAITVIGTDRSHEYITENADYRS